MICPQCSQKYAPGPTLCWNCRIPLRAESSSNKTVFIIFGALGVIVLFIFGGVIAVGFRAAQLGEQARMQAAKNAPAATSPPPTTNFNKATTFKPNTPKPEPTPFDCAEGSAYELTSTKWEKG